MCWGCTRTCAHCLDFQYKFFSYAFSVVKNRPWYVNFSIPPCGKWCFSQGSTILLGVNYCECVPQLRNKNLKRLIKNLLEKVVFFASITVQSSLGTWKKNFFFNFECYDLAIGNKWVSSFCTNHLAFKKGCFEAILTKNTLCLLRVNENFANLWSILDGIVYLDHITLLMERKTIASWLNMHMM
jgi:hypothetical protein